MFRGGGYAHRGTGITSGLTTPKRGYVDGPGSYQGIGESSLPSGVEDKWQAALVALWLVLVDKHRQWDNPMSIN